MKKDFYLLLHHVITKCMRNLNDVCAICRRVLPLKIEEYKVNLHNFDHLKIEEYWSASKYATVEGNLALLQNIVSLGFDVKSHSNLIILASQYGNLKIVKYLAERKVDLQIVDQAVTPLFMAAGNGHLGIVIFLVEQGVEVNKGHSNGVTPIFIASVKGYLKIVKFLANHGADINQPMNDGPTPLYMAVQEGQFGVVKFLLERGADVNKVDNVMSGATPIFTASVQGYFEIVKLLANHGANINHTTMDGSSPIYVAIRGGHFDVVKFFIHRGVNPNKPIFNGETPTQIANHRKHISATHRRIASYLFCLKIQ